MRSFACRFFDFGFVNRIVQFQLIKKVRGNAKSLRVTKRWIYLVLNHAQYEKQIQENFVYVQVLKASVHMYCVSLVFLAYLRVRVFKFSTLLSWPENVCSHRWSYFIQPKYVCSQEQLSRSKRRLLLIFIPSFSWRLKTNIL